MFKGVLTSALYQRQLLLITFKKAGERSVPVCKLYLGLSDNEYMMYKLVGIGTVTLTK